MTTPTNWDELWEKFERHQQATYEYKAVIVGFNKLAHLFLDWMKAHKKFDELLPDTDNSSTVDTWLKEFEATLELPPMRVRMAKKWGHDLATAKFSPEPGPPRPARKPEWGSAKKLAAKAAKLATAPPTTTPPPEPEPAPMSPANPPEDEDLDGTEEENELEQEEEEAPLRRRPPPRAQQVVMVTAPAPRRPRVAIGPPRSKIIPTTEAIRISKRGSSGHLDYVGEYNTLDLNGMTLERFINENIHEEHGELNGTTTYEVVALDSQGRPRGQATSIRISSGNSQGSSNDPIDQVRSAVELVNELQHTNAEREAANRAILDEGKRKAMGEGNLPTLMMMMMMEKMNGGNTRNDTDLVMKIAEKLGIGAPHPPPPPMPPPWTMHPMAPPQRHDSGVDKLVELMVAKAANPPTLADSLKELMLFQQMMNPRGAVDPELAALKLEVAVLRSQLGGGTHASPAGIEGALGNFEKLTAVVKQLAPQLNAGGITGAIQSIMTPDLMKAAGNLLAQSLTTASPGGPNPAPAALPTGAPVVAPPAPPPPSKPVTIEPPPAVREKVNALRIAQTREVQVNTTVELVQTMYLGPYREMLEPVLGALLAGKVDPARQSVAAILSETRADLNQPTFVDDVLREMFKRAGTSPGELPVELRLADEGKKKVSNGANGANGADVIPIPTAAQAAHAAQTAAAAKAKTFDATKFEEMKAETPLEAKHTPHAPEMPASVSPALEAKHTPHAPEVPASVSPTLEPPTIENQQRLEVTVLEPAVVVPSA